MRSFGKLRTYFGRGFIGIINGSINVTILNDEYYENGILKKLLCECNEADFNKIKEYEHRLVNLQITGAKTKIRKEEFLFKKDINIDKIKPEINNVDGKMQYYIHILEK